MTRCVPLYDSLASSARQSAALLILQAPGEILHCSLDFFDWSNEPIFVNCQLNGMYRVDRGRNPV
eukprot:6191474-Pleurochrysis_carterae.AAC.2